MHLTKKLKDPIYGYVYIPVEYMTDIIDTAEFQRLRRIVQTSYAPLYSSAIHNRFVHSIGVFYLGQIASKRLVDEIVRKNIMDKEQVEMLASVYRLACLLHDVGHAPFSHTGECFYKNKEFKSAELHENIAKLVKSKTFTKELQHKEESEATAPHELMSVIVGIKKYGAFLNNSENREFFARCITGYKYDGTTEKNQIKNCFISMLNSKVIDVDRLDYLLRDAYTTGFETVSIDYKRLLNALTIVNCAESGYEYQIAYKKDALSIIENVAYAHDAERKWIQNHPVVLYEAYIIKHIIMNLNENLNTNTGRLFSEEALSSEGVVLNGDVKVSLLCDDDIVYLYKNMFPDNLSSELLDRRTRRHPIWKSEAEYLGYVKDLIGEGKAKKAFDLHLTAIAKGKFEDLPSFAVIDDEYIERVKKEDADAKELLRTGGLDERSRESVESNLKGIRSRLAFCKRLSKFAKENRISCDYVILKAGIFNSNFSKEYLRKTLIVFNDGTEENVYFIDEVCNTLKSEKVEGDMFYIFCRNKKNVKIKGIKEFCKKLFLDTVGAE